MKTEVRVGHRRRLSAPVPFDFFALLGVIVLVAACSSPPETATISLVDRFSEATVAGAQEVQEVPPRTEWRFDGTGTVAVPDEAPGLMGWEALGGIEDLEIREGHLVGRSTGSPLLIVSPSEDPDPNDHFHALEIQIRVSDGHRLAVAFESDDELDREELVADLENDEFLDFSTELLPGDELQTYTLSSANATFNTSLTLSRIRHILIRPTDAEGAEFEIASARLVSLKEHLAAIPSGVGWHGLSDVFQETIVARSPERISFDVDLPSAPFLDLSIGTVDSGPVTYVVEVESGGSSSELFKRTVTTAQRWHSTPVDLGDFAGRSVSLSLTVQAERPGTLGFWGSPVVRNRAGQPDFGPSSAGRSALASSDPLPPQGVILIIADTLRRDHLQPYGYERDTSPVLTGLANDGAVFKDAIAQGTWTKVSVSSIVTSLYPTTHGVSDMPDRLPAGVTTLAEAYRSAGYATFATSSVPFTGKLTNMHQGVEVLHESSSVPDFDFSESKTSRTYTDRLLEWIELHSEVPFFAFLHVFDPHSPFEPYLPYDSVWLSPEEAAEHREQMEQVKDFIDDDFRKSEGLPNPEELAAAGIDQETFVSREKAWYDASILAMDVELGRLVERLEELGLAEDTLIAFVSDHGEEFLEHGRHFHGYNTYGEMLNVPLILHWPTAIPDGVVVEQTVQAIDLMPTLLELSRLPVPEQAQGQSLLPLLAEANPASLGWASRPAIAERSLAPAAFSEEEDPDQVASFAIVYEGWKLIKNTTRPEGWPEYELYDHEADPLNADNVAEEHPEMVERLAGYLEKWHEAALEARVEAEVTAESMSAEELQQLRSLGYIQ
jgi:arylsulfatase